MNTVISIENYINEHYIVEQIYSGSQTLVSLGIRTGDRHLVILKILQKEYPHFNELIQFQNQYKIAKFLQFSGIIQVDDLEHYRNGYVLVMEDFWGIYLCKFAQGKPV